MSESVAMQLQVSEFMSVVHITVTECGMSLGAVTWDHMEVQGLCRTDWAWWRGLRWVNQRVRAQEGYPCHSPDVRWHGVIPSPSCHLH